MKRVLFLILFTLILAACNQPNEVDVLVSDEQGSNLFSMPEEMPEDFGFSVRYGVGKKNEIDTFNGVVIKDLISNGTAKANITFSDKEMSEIYQKMKEINVLEEKNFTSNCAIEPNDETDWEIVFNGETLFHSITQYCDPTEDAVQFLELRDYVFDKVKSKKEYLKLPEAEGGYE